MAENQIALDRSYPNPVHLNLVKIPTLLVHSPLLPSAENDALSVEKPSDESSVGASILAVDDVVQLSVNDDTAVSLQELRSSMMARGKKLVIPGVSSKSKRRKKGREAAQRRKKALMAVCSTSNSLSDSGIMHGNGRFWIKNTENEAQTLWALGKELGVSTKGQDEEVIGKMMQMEKRDQEMATSVANPGTAGNEVGN